jgi:hypothetical protein
LAWSARRAPSMTTPQPWSPPMTSTAMRIKSNRRTGKSRPAPTSGPGGYGEDLTSLVVAAGRANPVRNVRGGALRTGAELGQFEHAIVGAAHSLTAFGRLAFGYTHRFSSLTVKISVCLARSTRTTQFGAVPRWWSSCVCPNIPLANRDTPDYTTDVAEKRVEYRPGLDPSSPRNHCLPARLLHLGGASDRPRREAQAHIGTT